MQLIVRPLTLEDFTAFINYWFDMSPEDVRRLGVDPNRLPTRDRMRADLEAMLTTPVTSLRSFVLAWCVDGAAIGHSSLKEIGYGESAGMHLHMWRPDLRGKGLGPDLFCMSAIDFYNRFKLKEIFCEPKADNPNPNRMLQRVGFPLLGQRISAASELSAVATLNRYLIRRDLAEAYLRRAQPCHPVSK